MEIDSRTTVSVLYMEIRGGTGKGKGAAQESGIKVCEDIGAG